MEKEKEKQDFVNLNSSDQSNRRPIVGQLGPCPVHGKLREAAGWRSEGTVSSFLDLLG